MGNSAAMIRACRGPIVLITLGILTALETMGWYSLVRTWPVLLIVFGLLKLAERGAASQGEPPAHAPVQGPQS